LIFISHDVYFIRALAESVLHIDTGRLTLYHGDYNYYLEKSRATDARAALDNGSERLACRTVSPASNQPRTASRPSERTGPKTREQRRAEADARAAKSAGLKELRSRVVYLEKEVDNSKPARRNSPPSSRRRRPTPRPASPPPSTASSAASWTGCTPPPPNGKLPPPSSKRWKKHRRSLSDFADSLLTNGARHLGQTTIFLTQREPEDVEGCICRSTVIAGDLRT